MKFLNVILLLLSFSLSAFGSNDRIIMRNGNELNVKLYQINDQIIKYAITTQNSDYFEVPSSKVYMVYIEKQGNIYITPEGKRITGETKAVNGRRMNTIYLVKGGEIGANEVRIGENDIQYTTTSKGKGINRILGSGDINSFTIKREEVFMIRYKNGMRDIITSIENLQEEKKETQKTDTIAEPKYVVVFHSVEKGETLNSISEKYAVTPEKIIEWNELSPGTKKTTPLTVDMQLMIYQPKKQTE